MTPTNTGVAGIEVNSLAAVNATTRASGKATLGQADFLKLLTTQLQTQDPFQPMDTQSMVAQMSQLSTNTGIAEMNASLQAIAAKLDASIGGSRLSDAASWIGRDALVAGDFVNRSGNGSFRGSVNLDAAADTVTVDLLDANGLIVHTEGYANVAAGAMPFGWDGQGANGAVAGPLKVRVAARASDRAVPTTTNVWTPVTAVQSPAGGTAQRLVTPNGLIAPEAAIRLG